MDGMCDDVLEMFERDILAHFDEKDATRTFDEAKIRILPSSIGAFFWHTPESSHMRRTHRTSSIVHVLIEDVHGLN